MSTDRDIAACLALFGAQTCNLLELVNYALSWLLLVGTVAFLLIRIYDRVKKKG